ncbi:MAG TPA: hypothetical protein VLG50_05725 [Candidatus Saccharimonadales bacterium]|nr:hypothetical protein [Candidatus Saccharimonadales bacterium]
MIHCPQLDHNYYKIHITPEMKQCVSHFNQLGLRGIDYHVDVVSMWGGGIPVDSSREVGKGLLILKMALKLSPAFESSIDTITAMFSTLKSDWRRRNVMTIDGKCITSYPYEQYVAHCDNELIIDGTYHYKDKIIYTYKNECYDEKYNQLLLILPNATSELLHATLKKDYTYKSETVYPNPLKTKVIRNGIKTGVQSYRLTLKIIATDLDKNTTLLTDMLTLCQQYL